MLRTLVAFLPDSMMVLVIMIVGLCLIVGVLSRRKALQWLGYVVLLFAVGHRSVLRRDYRHVADLAIARSSDDRRMDAV
jgi:hypothetical protein